MTFQILNNDGSQNWISTSDEVRNDDQSEIAKSGGVEGVGDTSFDFDFGKDLEELGIEQV
jgi:hypothetical protein